MCWVGCDVCLLIVVCWFTDGCSLHGLSVSGWFGNLFCTVLIVLV